ncbi:MAG: hypothetical protein L0G99_17700 [Propionibacteriales bacterium]|nr:hypothetical protein [Propionibacteriales bacterium]
MDVVWHWIFGHWVPLTVVGAVLIAVLIGIVAMNRDIGTPGKGTSGGSASAGGMFGGFEEIFAPNAHSAHTELERQRRIPATRLTAQNDSESEPTIKITNLPDGRLRAVIRRSASDDSGGAEPKGRGPA